MAMASTEDDAVIPAEASGRGSERGTMQAPFRMVVKDIDDESKRGRENLLRPPADWLSDGPSRRIDRSLEPGSHFS